jgi:hypothetical protein
MQKQTGRDYPLSPTPDPPSDSLMSRKDYRRELKQAKMKHNIEAAKEGKLNEERYNKIKNVTNTVGDLVGSVTGAKGVVGIVKGLIGRKKKDDE